MRIKLLNLNKDGCTKTQSLMAKIKENEWRRSNYKFCHAKTLNCAERKAFVYINGFDDFQ